MSNNYSKTSAGLIVAVLLSAMLFSCSKNDIVPGIPPDLCADFATYVESNTAGSVFTLRKNGDSDLITLTAAGVMVNNEQVKPGNRVIIQYIPSGGQQPYQSGPISLYSITKIINGGVGSESLETIRSWSSDPVKMMTLNRSGQYLDVWAEATFDDSIIRFSLTVDESTVDDSCPQLYLVFESDEKTVVRTHQIYASFDLSSVWDLPTCEGININYRTQSGQSSVAFQKTE